MAAAVPATRSARLPWDGLQVAIAVALLMQVWRLQDLFPMLRLAGLPIAASLLPLLFLAFNSDRRRKIPLSRPSTIKIALGILVLAILSVPGSVYPGASAQFLLKDYWRSIAALVVVAGSVRVLGDVERYVWLEVVGATLFCGVVLWRFQPTASGRLGELEYYDSNDLALLIVCTLPLAIYLLRRSSGIAKRLFVLGAMACLLATMVKTGSRGGFLGLLAAMAYMVFFLKSVRLPTRIGTAVVIGALFLSLSTDRYWDMMQTILHPTNDYNWAGKADVGRMELWKRGLGYMASYPLLGVGADAFSSAEGTLAEGATRQERGIGWKWSEAHNSFIQIGAELGVFGLLLFVAMLYSGFRALARVSRSPQATGPPVFLAQVLSASLVAFVVSGFFLSAAYGTNLYVLLGIAVGLAKVSAPAPAFRAAPSARRTRQIGWRERPVPFQPDA